MTWDRINDLVKIYTALASKTRLKILRIILDAQRDNKPIHIKGVANALKLDYGLVYRHLDMLKEAGLLTVYEVGRSRVPYIKKPEELEKLINSTLNLI